MTDLPRILISFQTVEALSAWYTEYRVSGSAALATALDLSPGARLKLIVTAREAGPFEVAATVLGPSADPVGYQVSLEARADLREQLARHALTRRTGRVLSISTGRRRHQRFETYLRARFRSYQQLLDEYVTNISHGGLFIRTDSPPPMGEQVTVAVTFPGENAPREITGEVVRIVTQEESARAGIPAGAGIAFELDEASFGPAIDRLLTKYLARASRVLVVDDAELFRRMLSEQLLERGYEVLTAANGYVGARLLAEHLYELDGVLLDLEMPGLTGWMLLDRIRALKREASFRLVVVSGQTQEQLDPLRNDGGADDAISKLMPIDDLIDRVQQALGSTHRR